MNVPPLRVRPEDWKPSGVDDLEPNALVVVKATSHCAVLAGPGAGKTELLAQRAAFLLQTGTSAQPRRILAISFKRDAARNLAQRVRRRCHRSHSARFDSMTFDAFAKGLLDRFGQALPDRWRPKPDYAVLMPKDRFYTEFLQRCTPPRDLPFQQSAVRAIQGKTFERRFVVAQQLPKTGWTPTSPGAWAGQQFWDTMLRGDAGSGLTFPMITRLAELLVRTNSAVRNALALTYSHVFMDEFQDTTQGQFDLVRTIFHGTPTVLTAVGDNKQQIMRFALAMDDPFTAFETTYGAPRIALRNNYRSSAELVRIQHVLAKVMDGGSVEPQSKARTTIQDACCQIWDFASAQREASYLAAYVAAQIKQHQLTPRDFVLLVRQKADEYAVVLEPAFRAAGIPLRNESTYIGALQLQELLTEPLSGFMVTLARLATSQVAGVAWPAALQALADFRGIDYDDEAGRRHLARDLDDFVTRFAGLFPASPTLASIASDVVVAVVDFLRRDALVAGYAAYAQGDWLEQVENSVAEHLLNSSLSAPHWAAALDAYEGLHSSALMTLHKSKGLEYHTVICVALDDSAWWSFEYEAAEATAGFFVAFTRAKQRVIFSYAPTRGARRVVAPLYQMLKAAGVTPVRIT